MAELTDRLRRGAETLRAASVDEQMALMEKSYELAAKYMNGQRAERAQRYRLPVAGTVTREAATPQPVKSAIRDTTVSGLQQLMSNAEFIGEYSKPRNYGFNTAVGRSYSMDRNTIAACVHHDQTLTDGQTVKLRLLEPMQAGNVIVPKNTAL